ncbi:MAG: hypothetical protein ACI9CA_000439 [Natronomonas sp.]|jgi:hypothetical protein
MPGTSADPTTEASENQPDSPTVPEQAGLPTDEERIGRAEAILRFVGIERVSRTEATIREDTIETFRVPLADLYDADAGEYAGLEPLENVPGYRVTDLGTEENLPQWVREQVRPFWLELAGWYAGPDIPDGSGSWAVDDSGEEEV